MIVENVRVPSSPPVLIVDAVSWTLPFVGRTAVPPAALLPFGAFDGTTAAELTGDVFIAGIDTTGRDFLTTPLEETGDFDFGVDAGVFTAAAFGFEFDLAGLDAAAVDLTAFAGACTDFFAATAFFTVSVFCPDLTLGAAVFATGAALDAFTFFTAILNTLKNQLKRVEPCITDILDCQSNICPM
jgi:hypothetical protein